MLYLWDLSSWAWSEAAWARGRGLSPGSCSTGQPHTLGRCSCPKNPFQQPAEYGHFTERHKTQHLGFKMLSVFFKKAWFLLASKEVSVDSKTTLEIVQTAVKLPSKAIVMIIAAISGMVQTNKYMWFCVCVFLDMFIYIHLTFYFHKSMLKKVWIHSEKEYLHIDPFCFVTLPKYFSEPWKTLQNLHGSVACGGCWGVVS